MYSKLDILSSDARMMSPIKQCYKKPLIKTATAIGHRPYIILKHTHIYTQASI